jgi:hypothetical protein
LLPLVLVGLTIFIVDPLQHYRPATFYRPLRGNERYYNPGFAKHYDYDCIIVGSCMVENFIPSEAGRKLSRQVLLAPLDAGTPYEECVLLNTALKTGKVKAVIWGLDIFAFMGGTRQLANGPGSFPFYLYDDNPFNDYKYLWNIDVLRGDCWMALAANLLPRWKLKYHKLLDLDSACFWGDQHEFSREAALESWGKKRREHPVQAEASQSVLDSMKRDFDVNVIPLVERHPEATYYLFYPPYSILFWTVTQCPFETQMEFKRHVLERTRRFPNVRLFDFQDVADITLNLDNYDDYEHYSPDVNRFVIDAFSKNEYLVTDNNIEEKIGRLENQVRRFTDSLDTEKHE